MEETIGYEALFSAEELADIDPGSWDSPPEGPDGTRHSVFVGYPPGQYDGNEERYELECDVCDYIGAADTAEEARAMARLHEAFVATLAEKWTVTK